MTQQQHKLLTHIPVTVCPAESPPPTLWFRTSSGKFYLNLMQPTSSISPCQRSCPLWTVDPTLQLTLGTSQSEKEGGRRRWMKQCVKTEIIAPRKSQREDSISGRWQERGAESKKRVPVFINVLRGTKSWRNDLFDRKGRNKRWIEMGDFCIGGRTIRGGAWAWSLTPSVMLEERSLLDNWPCGKHFYSLKYKHHNFVEPIFNLFLSPGFLLVGEPK